MPFPMRRLAPTARLACALAVSALAGCEMPTAPEPTNPYDPAHDGLRVATAPSDLRVAESSPASISLAWTDNSSFETGVLVERAMAVPFNVGLRFETLAVLPPDATTYTDVVESDVSRRYRVTALAADDRDSAPSPSLLLRYPVERIPVDPLVAGTFAEARFSPDGATLYGRSSGGVVAVDARTGRLLGRFDGAFGIAGFLADGRVAVHFPPSGSAVLVRLYRGVVLESAVTLAATACSVRAVVVVSADGSRAVAPCSFGSAVQVWQLSEPLAPSLVFVGASSGPTAVVVGLSPDGRRLISGAGGETVAFDLDTRAVLWRAAVTVNGAALSPDGRLLLVSNGLERVALRDAATGAVLADAAGYVSFSRFAGDGASVLFSAPSNPTAFGSPGHRVARTPDLATLATLVRADPTRASPIPGGAVALDFERSPQVDILRWDFSRGWELGQ